VTLLDFCAELSSALGIPWRINRINSGVPGFIRINVTGLSRKREPSVRLACAEFLPCHLAFETVRFAK
jgi:hypothetical protein